MRLGLLLCLLALTVVGCRVTAPPAAPSPKAGGFQLQAMADRVGERCIDCHREQAGAIRHSKKFLGNASPLYRMVQLRTLKPSATGAQGWGSCHTNTRESADLVCMSCHGLAEGGRPAPGTLKGVVFGPRANSKCRHEVRA